MKKLLILLIVVTVSCCFDTSPPGDTLKIMSWNVQNLFDGVDDGTEYSDFSVSQGYWTEELYNRRLKILSRIILLNNPDVVALQEIEGEKVLIDFKDKYLKEYEFFASTCYDGAVQLGFLSKIPIRRVGYINPNTSVTGLRDLLEVTFEVGDSELVVINNHWKSKRGGFTEHLRLKSAQVLKKRLVELKDMEVVVLGDLNENYNEYQKIHKSYSTALLFDSFGDGITLRNSRLSNPDSLYSPWPDSNFPGSYKYRGEWETIDHILLNRELMNREGFYFKSFYVDSREELFDSNQNVYRWDKEKSIGVSDHLPILVELGLQGIEITLE